MCENCGQTDRPTEPFNDGQKRWQNLCGKCKVLTTMTPAERFGFEQRQLVAKSFQIGTFTFKPKP